MGTTALTDANELVPHNKGTELHALLQVIPLAEGEERMRAPLSNSIPYPIPLPSLQNIAMEIPGEIKGTEAPHDRHCLTEPAP